MDELPKLRFPADDRYVRFTFADTTRVAGLLREYLPADLIACLDLPQLRRIHDQHVKETLHELRDDLDLECPIFPTGNAVIRILVEYKSGKDKDLWFQLNRSIVAIWERSGFAPVIPVVIHTGPEKFSIHSPQTSLQNLPQPLARQLLELPIQVIDLSCSTEDRIWNSVHLDHVAKVALTLLRLAQQASLDVLHLRKILRDKWPNVSIARQKRYIIAAITYLKFKSRLPAEIIKELRNDMALVHPINPLSVFAQELREAKAAGLSEGISQGIEQAKLCDIEKMLAKGFDWSLIQDITSISSAEYETLLAKYR